MVVTLFTVFDWFSLQQFHDIPSINFFSLCHLYDDVSDRCQEMPDTTKEIVELVHYLSDASTAKVVTLQSQVNEAAERLQFLLTYAHLSGMLICLHCL